MKQTIILLVICLCFHMNKTWSQSPLAIPFGNDRMHHEKSKCGTPHKTPSQFRYSLDVVKNIPEARNSGTTCIGIAAHIVRNDDGSGGLSLDALARGVANLNYLYLDAGIEFFICSVDYANNTDYYEFDEQSPDSDTEAGLVSLFTESTTAANVYFINSITLSSGFAAAGYAYYPCNSMVCTRSLMTIGATDNALNGTFAHEFGHFFDLAHTHDQTENGNTDPQAERVVRTGGSANCDTNGDTFCDTDADPRYSSGSFDFGSCSYTGTATDDLGTTYAPTTAINNIMSYYPDACGGVFTAEQYAHISSALTVRQGHTVYDIDGCVPTTVTAASALAAVQNGGTSIDLT